MNGLNVICTQGTVVANFDELKENLTAMMETYKDYTVTEGSVKQAKKDLATLNKMEKAINDRKIAVKKEYSRPLTEFEAKAKELMSLITAQTVPIKQQIKMFDDDAKARKKKDCEAKYHFMMGDLELYASFDSQMHDDWLNASTDMKTVESDISGIRLRVKQDIEAIKALHSADETAVLEDYKSAGLAHAIHLNSVLCETARRAAERAQREYELADKDIEPEKSELAPATDSAEPVDPEEIPFATDSRFTFTIDASDSIAVMKLMDDNGIHYQVT